MTTTDITTITNHVELALARSATQYKDQPKHEAFIRAFSKQVQDLEDATFGMIDARTIELSTGLQLDNLGTIVDQAREGAYDDRYRVLLFVKIGQNTSQGGPEKVINIFQLLTAATLVHYINLGTGAVMLGSDVLIAPDQINSIYQDMELVIAGGVRVDHIVCFDPTEPFAFSGPNTSAPGAGFSDITGLTGGKFAVLHRKKIPFAFAGNNVSDKGFGSLLDSQVGGTFVKFGG